jgi:hypothetical protein
MKIEPIIMFEYYCTPMNSFPIKSCTVVIYAKDREEADKIFMENDYKFFDQHMNTTIRELAKGYRQVEE